MKTAEDIRALKGAGVNGVLIAAQMKRKLNPKIKAFIRTVRDFR